MNKKRKILVCVSYRSEWVKLREVVKYIKNHPQLELQIVVLGAMLLEDFGSAYKEIEKEFKIDYKLHTSYEGGTLSTMGKSIASVINDLSIVIPQLSPDLAILYGDRFEIMGSCVALSFQNIPIVHI